MKNLKRGLFFFLFVIVILLYLNYPKLNLISGFASKSMASSVFIGKQTAESVSLNENNFHLIKMADATVNTNTATSSVFGLMKRKSVYREGLGCVLVNDDYNENEPYQKPNRFIKKDTLPYPFGHQKEKDTIFENVDYGKLNAAIENSFSEPDVKKTRTVLVAYKNNIIGEKYIDGFNEGTSILGWSMSKSIIATLYGILQYQGKLDVNSRAPIAEWQKDDRKNITINHLLRMQSGLAWEEDYTKISDVTKMLFLDADMTKAQIQKEAIAKPTEVWNYSSGTSNLLSGILKNQFKTHQEYLDFPYQQLIDKIGMNSMLIEADMNGNYIGSSYAWATTRDWAKFGLLYLNNGKWGNERLFDEDWVKYITKPTQHSNGTYGGHFWLNANGKYPDVPKDMYSANGFQGQRVFIIPSKDLVIVRTGLAEEPDFNINTFLKEILSAIN